MGCCIIFQDYVHVFNYLTLAEQVLERMWYNKESQCYDSVPTKLPKRI